MTIQIANVSRSSREEGEQAIKDLIGRGFTVTYPLTEKKSSGKTFKSDDYRRRIFVENTLSSKWVAQLKREVVAK